MNKTLNKKLHACHWSNRNNGQQFFKSRKLYQRQIIVVFFCKRRKSVNSSKIITKTPSVVDFFFVTSWRLFTFYLSGHECRFANKSKHHSGSAKSMRTILDQEKKETSHVLFFFFLFVSFNNLSILLNVSESLQFIAT